jgi:hypothetical protein
MHCVILRRFKEKSARDGSSIPSYPGSFDLFTRLQHEEGALVCNGMDEWKMEKNDKFEADTVD